MSNGFQEGLRLQSIPLDFMITAILSPLFFDSLLHFIQALRIPFCRESVVLSLWLEAGVMTW